MKIKFKPMMIYLKLSSGKILNIPVCVILVRFVFQKNYYPQVFLHECFYEYEYELQNGSYVIV